MCFWTHFQLAEGFSTDFYIRPREHNILVAKESSRSQYNMSPRQVRITSDNRGPLVNIANWITLVVVCLATLTKIATKPRKIGRPQGDDFIMFAAMVWSVSPFCAFEKIIRLTISSCWFRKSWLPQVKALQFPNKSKPVWGGISVRWRHLKSKFIKKWVSHSRRPNRMNSLGWLCCIEQTGYAAQLLFVFTLCLPKFAVLHFLSTIAISKICRMSQKGIVAINFVWAFVAVIIIASQCASSQPWAILSNQCSDQVSLSEFGIGFLLKIQSACSLGFHWDRWYCRQCCYHSLANVYPLWPPSAS